MASVGSFLGTPVSLGVGFSLSWVSELTGTVEFDVEGQGHGGSQHILRQWVSASATRSDV